MGQPNHKFVNEPIDENFRVLRFYRHQIPNSSGSFLQTILSSSNDWLEHTHDWVQWVFPTNERSAFNENAPILTMDECVKFQADMLAMADYQNAIQRFWTFLGLKLDDGRLVSRGATVPSWLIYPNHNWLRISRLLRSNRLLGATGHAEAMLEYLQANLKYLPHTSDNPIPHWNEAAIGELWK